MNNLRDWWKWHNSLDTTVEKCPEVVLHAECLADELNTWLPVYVAETRNKEGKRYSPKMIYSLLTGILRHMTTENPRYPNFLDKKNPEFVDFHRSPCLKLFCSGLCIIDFYAAVLHYQDLKSSALYQRSKGYL